MVSIIIPVYNSENTINKCLNSCINQTYRDIEILLIDDGSTDASPQKCDDFQSKDNRIRVFHQKNAGVSSARNLGLEYAKGDFVTFVDSDDWINKDMIETLVNVQKAKDYGIVICGHRIITDEDKSQYNDMYIPEIYSIDQLAAFLLKPQNESAFRSPCGRLFKLSIIKNNDLWFNTELTLGEDTLFNYRYISFISSAVCVNNYYGYNVKKVFSLEKSTRYYNSAKFIFNSRMKMFNGFSQLFSQNGLYEKYKEELSNKYIYSLSIIESICVFSGAKKSEIIEQNKKLLGRIELKNSRIKKLRFRDKYTLVCYRNRWFNLLYYSYLLYHRIKCFL